MMLSFAGLRSSFLVAAWACLVLAAHSAQASVEPAFPVLSGSALSMTNSAAVTWENWLASAQAEIAPRSAGIAEAVAKTKPTGRLAQPNDALLSSAHVLTVPLVPFGPTSPELNGRFWRCALASAALGAQAQDAWLWYLTQEPQSPWRVSVLVHLGRSWFGSGDFSKAQGAYYQAWMLGKAETDSQRKVVADLAAGEYLRMLARVGRYVELKAFFKDELKERQITGDAAQFIEGVHDGLSTMEGRPEVAFMCGPLALGTLRRHAGDSSPSAVLAKARSGKKGFNFAQLLRLSTDAGMGLQLAKRDAGAPVIVPSLVHWRLGHFAALTTEHDGRYTSEDPTFLQTALLNARTLDEEASGYFLVPSGKLPEGWHEVTVAEAQNIWGRGTALIPPEAGPPDFGPVVPSPGCPRGMPVASVQMAVVGLLLSDTPVTYRPPKGGPVGFSLTYWQRGVDSARFGGGWLHNWSSYILATANGTQYEVHVLGGGLETYNASNFSKLKSLPNSPGTGLAAGLFGQLLRTFADGHQETYSPSPVPNEWYLSQIKDIYGNMTQLGLDATWLDKVGSITDPSGGVCHFSYNTTGQLVRFDSPTNDQSAVLAYDSSDPNTGKLSSITDALGLQTTFTYAYNGAEWAVDSMTTPYGTTRFVIGNSYVTGHEIGTKRWIETTDPSGEKERVEMVAGWLPDHFPAYTETTVPNGFTMFGPSTNHGLDTLNTFYWDKRGMREAPGNYRKAHIYHWLQGAIGSNGSNFLESYKAPLESRIWYAYPGEYGGYQESTTMFPKPSRVARLLDTTTNSSTQTYLYEYTPGGEISKLTDPLGRETKYSYDGQERLLSVQQKVAAGYETLESYTYNSPAPNQVLPDSQTNGAGQTWHYTYAVGGMLASVQSPSGLVTTYHHDSNGRLDYVRPPTVTDQVDFQFDSHNRIWKATTAHSGTKTFTYDAFDRPLTVSYPDGTSESYSYDRLDLASATDRLNRSTSYTHNALRQLTSITDPSGRSTRYDWCSCGALNSLMDGKGQSTNWAYDLQGRLITKEFADGSRVNYQHEKDNGRLKAREDALGQVTNYSYFLDDQVKDITYQRQLHTTPDVHLTYDANYPRLASMQDGLGTSTYTYNPNDGSTLGAGLLHQVSGPFANSDLVYGYDLDSRLNSRSVNGTAETMHYDAQGRMDYTTNALGTFTHSFDTDSERLKNVAYPNGANVALDYQIAALDGRLKQIKNLLPNASVLSQFDYAQDVTGKITRWDQTLNGVHQYYSLGYNLSDELTSGNLKDGGSDAVLTPNTFGYDPAGNRSFQQMGTQSSAAYYNNLNQLTGTAAAGPLLFEGTATKPLQEATVAGVSATITGATFDALVPSGTGGSLTVSVQTKDFDGNQKTKNYQVTTLAGVARALTYDANGNLLNDGTHSYQWDGENRLIQISQGAGASLSVTTMAYDGLSRRLSINESLGGNTIAQRRFVWAGTQIAEERDASNATVKRFFSQGVRVGDGAQGVSYYYMRDHLGSIRSVLDSSGASVAEYDYSLFGLRTKLSGTFDADLGYTGHFQHELSGLSLTLYRAYDPKLGRWLSRDPIGERGGVNLYGYLGNHPLLGRDPLGLDWLDDTGDFAAGFGDTLTFGATAAARRSLGGDNVDRCSSSYSGGTYSAYAWQAAMVVDAVAGAAWSAGLNGGANSVFWSGFSRGARAEAVALAERIGGTTLEQTPIGGAMDFVHNTIRIELPQSWWTAASAQFARNAEGTAHAVIRAAGRTWANTELPILLQNGVTIVFH